MQMTRYLRYTFLGMLAAFVVPFASALERPASYVLYAVEDMQAPAMARYEAALASWAADTGVGAGSQLTGLRAESNHFVMTTILPEPVLAG